MTLKTRLLAVALPLAVISALSMTLLAKHAVVAIITEQIEARGHSLAEALSRQPGLIEAMAKRDEGALLERLQTALRSGAAYAAVTDGTGRVLAHTNVAETGRKFPAATPERRRIETARGPLLEVSAPVRLAPSGSPEELFLLGSDRVGATRGWIRLGMPLSEGLATAATISRRVMLAIALVGLLTLGLALALMNRLLAGIAALAAATRGLASGRLGEQVQVSGGGRDELSALADSFNSMSRALAQTTVSKDFVDGILENMGDAVVVLSLEGKVRLLNPAAETLLGPSDKVKDLPALLLFVSGGERFSPEALQALPPDEGLPTVEASVKSGQGEVSVLATCARIKGVAPAQTGFVLTLKDITARKKAEQALARYADELARSNSELEQFAYVASHDLQEPLRKVSNYCQLLERRYKGKLDEEADSFIHYAVDGASRMKQLIDDLLAYSRVGRKDLKLQPIDLSRAVERALESLELAINESGAKISVAELPRVLGDVPQLGQVFQNLIGNALKFRDAQRKPELALSALRDGEFWIISVRDNGIGIDPKFFGRLFQIFQRLHTRQQYSGSGIGLSISRRIVERHGGRIWVESQPGHGSDFKFTLKSAD